MKVTKRSIDKVQASQVEVKDDLLAVEEPLEIRLKYHDQKVLKEKSLTVTMRTPGNDLELVTGFLFCEGIISHFDHLEKIFHCKQVKSSEEIGNVVIAQLRKNHEPDLKNLDRYFYASSSCGVCGKSSIEALEFRVPEYQTQDALVSRSVITKLPELMRKNQLVYGYTGGLHAAGLFSLSGSLQLLREDIGRHNALDKLIGAAVGEKQVPLSKHVLVVSGRLGFELIQKAIMAGIKIITAIGAPSSLAVKLADAYDVTLIGFAKQEGFNIYAGNHRIID